jgi:hypothetical protein
VDQISLAQEEPVERIRQLSGALLHEGGGGMRGDAGDLDTPCRQFHHYEHIIGYEAMPRRHLDCEKVRGGEDLPMQLQELCPAHPALAAVRRWLEVMATQDITHRARVDVVPQIREGALDAAIAPGGILFGHADDQLLNLLDDTGSTKVVTVVQSSLKFPLHQCGMKATHWVERTHKVT